MNTKIGRIFLASLMVWGLGATAWAYVYAGSTSVWLPGSIPFQIKLGSATTLQDGTNYSTSVQAAMTTWNAQLGTVQFVPTIVGQSGDTDADHEVNEIVFSSKVEGEDYGEGVLAITYSYSYPSIHQRTTADIFFNTAYTWNSYRGNLQEPEDIRRVALHELGHALGLAHPDTNGQSVTAIMNSTASDVDTLAADDIAGAQSLYRAPGDTTVAANNDFANASVVTLVNNGAQLTASNVYTSKQTGEPNHAGYNGGRSVWWKWTAPSNGSMALTTEGSYFDTLLAVYTGLTVSALTPIASNDQATPSVGYSAVTFDVISGTTYSIAVDGWSAESGFVSLALAFTPAVVNSAPAITGQPASMGVLVGQTATFSVSASGVPAPGYQWQRFAAGGGVWTDLSNGANYSGVSTATLTVTSTTTAMNGDQFRCVATSIAGSATSNSASLAVTGPPAIVSQPTNQSVITGQSASFSVTASGTGPLVYQWRKNGNNIGGATSSTYTIAVTVEGDAGAYSVVVSNGAGSATSNSASLVVTTPPAIVSQPTNQSVITGQPASFSVTASGTGPLGYQWRKNGNNIGGATSSTYTIAVTVEGDAGAYSVVVSNGAGSATSNSASLVVTTPPAIVSQPTNQSVITGQPASFSVTASGTGPLGYQWRKNGNNIGGATSSTYTIAVTVEGDAGAYSVVVSNGAGNATSNEVGLTVTTPPSITSHPADQDVIAGQPVSFSVTASGSSPLSYQWQVLPLGEITWSNVGDGGRYSNAQTANLQIAFVTIATDDGDHYRCVVDNAAGSAASNPATLNVRVYGPDLDGNGWRDILWRNPTSGELAVWCMEGTTRLYSLSLGTSSPLWQTAGTGDFNGDGQVDILWRNPTSGELAVWIMNGSTREYSLSLGTSSPLWQTAGTGDFNGDGQVDILWRNPTSGELAVWIMNGTTRQYSLSLGTSSPLWQTAGTGDFNGDGQVDILWRNPTSGELAVWIMNGTTRQYSLSLGTSSPLWQTAGAGDFNGDGQVDILWRNPTSGELAVWIMNGSMRQYSLSLGTSSPLWQTAP